MMNALAGGCTFLVIALIAAALGDCNTGYTPSKSREVPEGVAMSMWPVWLLLICAGAVCAIVGVASLARQEQGNRHRIVRDLL